MSKDHSSEHPSKRDQQSGELSLRLGKNAGLDLRLKLTTGGILAVAALVSSILLSTAVLVGTAVHEGKR